MSIYIEIKKKVENIIRVYIIESIKKVNEAPLLNHDLDNLFVDSIFINAFFTLSKLHLVTIASNVRFQRVSKLFKSKYTISYVISQSCLE